MKKLKVSQIQFEAKPTPYENAKILSKYYKKTLVNSYQLKSSLIVKNAVSNINITSDFITTNINIQTNLHDTIFLFLFPILFLLF